MKRYLLVSLAAILGLGAFAPAAEAASLNISIGDRPYYHGAYYHRHHRRLAWVPGHWVRRHHHRVWVHGYYASNY